ncbi:DNA polymerase III subunit alpha [Algibacter amylolyticus]|uniref:DNA polymerase III subunit alpha n=1 Tax=Algibacter amylolyticus TaxID=1608400 RepID=A0A5M7B3Q8_9FLAO|nr:DNA polymerase III subunit alpha [Algibacter amylolyticus]KAA5821871.1 DNA polymerase III subunit alpha [Algibacter amylolyticus]MBB5269331.1 DNA polymerase-3 subunit alpha [Algibacter amylolyticus]TSJ73155.1 DNA polymerase III subunit alpha [Algibacter amylolyticus]
MYTNCHSYYSLRYGTFSEVDLLMLAKENGVTTLALTDINNTSACLNFVRQSQAFNIKPVIGIDFRNGAKQLYVGLASTNLGFQELNSFLSGYEHSKTALPELAPVLKGTSFIYPLERVMQLEKEEFQDNEFIGVSVTELKKLPFSNYKSYTNKLVIQQQVTIRNKRDFNAHRLLRAIDNNTLLSKLQKTEECGEHDVMLSANDLRNLYAEYPHIISNTEKLLDSCHINFAFGKDRVSQNQSVYLNSKEEDYQFLVKLCNDNLHKRYSKPDAKVKNRLETELKTIRQMDFVSYFLINYDIVSYSKSKGYVHVGRGSGANSIVAYIIGITDVDPIELDLYFERFINPFRASPPDFDIDFSWKEREDVTNYIFKRFKNVSLLATYNTFKYRAVVRELGKVFGLPKEEIDKLSADKHGQNKLDDISQLVLKYGDLIKGFPNHLSVHSCGVLILDKPIHYYSATNLPPKGFPTVQFDMIIAEDVGVFKFDILGQRGLAKIKDTIDIVKYNRPELPPIDITQVEKFKNDPNINALLKQGKAIGAYYVESPAMRGLMQKLQTQDYIGLVAASSIIRPGVSGSGMKKEFIIRQRYPEKRKEANPILLEIMPETYGIMVYQEDVLKVANKFAGLDLGEADVLRRGMSGKFRSRAEFTAVEEKFINNCKTRGYPDALTFEVWDQIKSFAGYAFAKGHSASYAVESYQSLYLKCYFPLEFMVAVLNNGGGFYSPEHYIHEARMCGGIIEAPCVNSSEHPNTISGKTIYLGFGYLKSLEILTIKRLLTERQFNGSFKSLDDFIDRVSISIEQLTILIRIDAFRFTKQPKTELLWQAIFKLNANKAKTTQSKLFKPKHKQFNLPSLKTTWIEDTYDQMELLGFPLCNYFDLVSDAFYDHIKAKTMNLYVNKIVLLYGVLVNTRFHKGSNGKRMRFCTFVDQEGDYFDTVHFHNVVEKYPINGLGVYACCGKISEEFGFCSVDIQWTKKLSLLPDPRGET